MAWFIIEFHSLYNWFNTISNTLRRGRHVVYNLYVHLVFVTKYRGKVFTKEVLDDLEKSFDEVCTKFASQLIAFNGESDHVHLLVNSLKGVSSRMVRKKKYHSVEAALWGGAPIETLKQYIEARLTIVNRLISTP